MAIEKCCDNCACEYLCDKHENMSEKILCYEFDCFAPKEELIRQDYKSQLIHDFREYMDIVIKYYNSLCGEPDGYNYGVKKGFEMAIKYIIRYDYKEK